MAKTNETSLEKANVSNNITLNLNQNDLIELAIEEKLSILEPGIDRLEKLIAEKEAAIKPVLRDIVEKHIDKKVKATKGYKEMQLIADLFKTKLVSQVTWQHQYEDSSITNNIVGKYKHIDFMNVQEYKDPINYAKRHTGEKTMRVTDFSYITVQLSLDQETEVGITYSHKVDSSTPREYTEKLKKHKAEIADLANQLYDLQIAYLDFKYGEKRIKSKLVKASLGKSAEGKAILDMLSKATNVKFIE